MIRRFFCHRHTVPKGTVTLIQPKEIITNEGVPFCVNCRHCFVDAGHRDTVYMCNKISKYNIVTGNKIYDTCENQRTADIGMCGSEGRWFSENL